MLTLEVNPKPLFNPSTNFSNLRGISVLLAEDNKINQQIAIELLAQVGVQVDVVDNGRLAVAKALAPEQNYAAILMDIQMPEMDGLEATRRIRKHNTDLPIIAMTAYALVQEKQHCYRAGMNDHIEKPVDPQVLYATLTRWIKPAKVKLALLQEPRSRLTTEDADNSTELLPETLLPFDLATALIRVNGNRRLLRKLLVEFYLQYRNLAEELTSASRDDTNRLAHTLKSTAAALGLAEVSIQAKNLEMALRNDEQESSQAAVAALLSALEPALIAASNLEPLPKTSTVTIEATSNATDTRTYDEIFNELQHLLLNHNLRARKTLTALTQHLPHDDARLNKTLDVLAERINQLDFDAALDILQALAQNSSEQRNTL